MLQKFKMGQQNSGRCRQVVAGRYSDTIVSSGLTVVALVADTS